MGAAFWQFEVSAVYLRVNPRIKSGVFVILACPDVKIAILTTNNDVFSYGYHTFNFALSNVEFISNNQDSHIKCRRIVNENWKRTKKKLAKLRVKCQ